MKLPIIQSRRLLSLAFVAVLLSILVSAAFEYWGLLRLDRAFDGIRRGDAALVAAAEGMRENVLELRRYEKDVFMNVGAEDLVRQYRAKWDLAFDGLRVDLAQARLAGSTSQDVQLHQVIYRIAEYRVAFDNIYDLILNGTIRTTQQANQAMSPFKDSVREAELALAQIGSYDRNSTSSLGPALLAQRLGLAATILSFLTLSVLFLGCVRRLPAVKYAA